MGDILDTTFEGKEVEIDGNRVQIGDDINLTQIDPTLRNILVGVGWDLNAFDADALDVDVSLFMVNKDNVTRIDEDFVYYNNMEALEGAVKHNGDSRTGAGDGDDESISIDLQGVPFDITNLLFVLSIYRADEKEQSMGMVRNVYIRIVNQDTGHEILRFELDNEFKDKLEAGVLVGSINREGPKWHFTPKAEFEQGGLVVMAERYGLIVGQK